MLSVIDELLTYINVRSFHWILLIIKVDKGTVQIMDPLDKNMDEYRDLLNTLQK